MAKRGNTHSMVSPSRTTTTVSCTMVNKLARIYVYVLVHNKCFSGSMAFSKNGKPTILKKNMQRIQKNRKEITEQDLKTSGLCTDVQVNHNSQFERKP